ncbi:PREDICTED: N-acetylmuramoyl-L-alanine amidase [Nanorana parkeri]|uniref:N-acetylmuramoyl-L-alanine amidase n=1 Tax=Nanorana parkeri TaxID=125878 RepID=UPI000854B28A|nr:PREDICTED: N-acetylmuramoyl-L-alanine amidase [Nanorana parkeri]
MAVPRLICIFILPVCFSAALPHNPAIMKMETFTDLIQELESTLPEWSAKKLAELLLSSTTEPSQPHQHLSDRQAALARDLLSHKAIDLEEMGWQEQGVVLAPDGSNVALRSLLDTVVWGWKADCDGKKLESDKKNVESSEKPRPSQESGSHNMYQVTLPSMLGLHFASFNDSLQVPLYVPDGCWDSISDPKTFQLHGAPSRNDLTLANINGVLDGALLREMIINETQKMSDLLQSYYGGIPARSPYRRQNFQELLGKGELGNEIERAIGCYRKQSKGSGLPDMTEEELKGTAAAAAKQFEQQYLDCPAVMPRCMWGAKPYKGTPTLLNLPLQHVYIHHTYEPSRPCLSLTECSKDMRSMQKFHQEERGWDDIGYSFVVGSDGYLYEGRGWHWVGAHTRGHNSIGYGVSFIGDFTASVPEGPILSLVRDRFLKCAVRSGYISSNYTIQGHRQVVNTSCPGDALFQKISTWENFKES